MPNWNYLRPQTGSAGAGTTHTAATPLPALWDPANAWEAQTQFWNQLVELSRSFWSVYTTPLQAMPWLLNTAPPLAAAEVLVEPVAVSDAASDALESQTRFWNHFLDAQRSFWSSYAWTLPETPWAPAGVESPAAAVHERNVAAAPARPRKTLSAVKRAKPGTAKLKAMRPH